MDSVVISLPGASPREDGVAAARADSETEIVAPSVRPSCCLGRTHSRNTAGEVNLGNEKRCQRARISTIPVLRAARRLNHSDNVRPHGCGSACCRSSSLASQR